ncbi:MAG: hypothetical protein HY543_06680 [Deltaproteobacteria bacterium]|nr:hypothetical protein [Deltaproteobacteria bacterium]
MFSLRRIFFLGLSCLMASMVVSRPLHATPSYFLFWYPGGAGDALAAQPLLDQFTKLLETELSGTAWRGIYIPVEDKGISFIRGPKPAFGIVSRLMYRKHRVALGMEAIATTRPLPHGKTEERLSLVKGPCTTASGAARIFGSEPFSLAYLREVFGAQGADALTAWPTGNVSDAADMRRTVQSIAESGSCSAAVLTEREQAAMRAIKAPWKDALRQVAVSAPIPTPPVVRFGAQPQAAALREALLRIGRSPAARAILHELRLAGFE